MKRWTTAAAAVGFVVSMVCGVSGSVVKKAGWPVRTGGAIMSSPCSVDLNEDGAIETLVGSFDGKLYVFEPNGEPVEGWPQATDAPIVSSPAVGDLCGDGSKCVVVGSRDGKVYAWDARGHRLRGWPVKTGGPVFSSPALAYLEGPSQMAVIVGSDDGKVYAFGSDGSPVPDWPVNLGAPVRSSPAVADLDRDGAAEVIAAAEGKKLFVIRSSGAIAPGWPQPSGAFGNGSPPAGDIDNDGSLEIFLNGNDYYFYAFRPDGASYSGEARWAPSQLGDGSPVLVDVNGDGKVEVGFLGFVPPETATVYFYNSQGVSLDGFPVTLKAPAPGPGLAPSLVVGDIDGDNQMEAVAAVGDLLYAWRLATSYDSATGLLRKAGETVEGFPIRLGGQVNVSCALADLDDDGRLDIVAGSADGKVYCFDMGIGSYNPDSLPWSAFRGNAMRTGAALPTSLDSGNLLARQLEGTLSAGAGPGGNTIELKSPVLTAQIDRTSASLVSLMSADLPGQELVQSPPGLIVYLWDKVTDRLAILSDCTSCQEITSASGKDDEPWLSAVRCELAPADGQANLARAVVTYGMLAANLEVNVNISAMDGFETPVELGVAIGMDMTGWVRQLYGNGQGASTFRAPKRVVARYYDHELDMTTGGAASPQKLAFPPAHHREGEETSSALDSPMFATNMPMAVLESTDAFLLWGYKNVDSFALFTPNHLVPGIGLTVTPREMPKGRSYEFNLFLKPFAKPETSLTEVCYWYAQQIYSTSPLSRDFVGLPGGYHEHRTMPFGNFTFHPGPLYFADQRNAEVYGITRERIKEFEERAQRNAMTLLWWSGGSDWAELFPTSGTWVNDFGFSSTPEQLKGEIARLKGLGFHPYRYLRQIYNLHFDNQPVYIDWAMPNRHGWPFNYTYGPRGDLLRIKPTLTPEQRWLHGFDPKHMWGPRNIHADFCNPDFLNWYEETTEAWLAEFRPDGVSWDMGWDSHVSPCTANRDDVPVKHEVPGGEHPGVQHGLLRAMADVREWAEQEGHEMLFFMNGSQNTPIMRYVDGVLFEGGWTASKEGIDLCKFYGTPVTNLCYSSQYPTLDDAREAAMRLLSYGVTHASMYLTTSERDMTEFYRFSARANSVPLIWEDDGIRFEWSQEEEEDNRAAELLNLQREYPTSQPVHVPPPGRLVTGSVWAGPSHVLVAIYNHKERAVPVKATLSEQLLRLYGSTGDRTLAFTVLGKDGFPLAEHGFEQDGLTIAGTLAPGSLLLGIAGPQ